METIGKILHSAGSLAEGGGGYSHSGTLTKMTGCPVAHNTTSMTAGPTGPVCLQDVYLIEKLAQFDREKIPARNVHALGTGCYGTFTVTNDISKYTRANLFSQVGQQTNLFVRFSGIFTEQGEADTVRDPRGFAIKFYTKEGNWDLLGINTPVFLIKDAVYGPDAIHACKRDPRTGMWNPTQTWDFVANHPEALHQMTMLYTDRTGTPMSYRHMNAYGCHTFSFINSENKRFWVKFHIHSEQGAKGFTDHQAKLMAGQDPNFLSRDLKEAIDRKDYPKWKLGIQIMSEEEGYRHNWTFDPTKVWKHSEYPIIDIGVIELNKNPIDYHAEVEQAAFSPMTIVPGISYSPDRLLQGRLFIYDDTQHHRIGAKYKQLYVNQPQGVSGGAKTLITGGPMQTEVKEKFPHYSPSSFGGPQPNPQYLEPPFRCDGAAGFYEPLGGDDHFSQVGDFIAKVLDENGRDHLADNLGISFAKIPDEIARKNIELFSKVNKIFGDMLERKWKMRKESNMPRRTEGEQFASQCYRTLGMKTAQSL